MNIKSLLKVKDSEDMSDYNPELRKLVEEVSKKIPPTATEEEINKELEPYNIPEGEYPGDHYDAVSARWMLSLAKYFLHGYYTPNVLLWKLKDKYGLKKVNEQKFRTHLEKFYGAKHIKNKDFKEAIKMYVKKLKIRERELATHKKDKAQRALREKRKAEKTKVYTDIIDAADYTATIEPSFSKGYYIYPDRLLTKEEIKEFKDVLPRNYFIEEVGVDEILYEIAQYD